MSDSDVPDWAKNYHRCSGKRATGFRCINRGVVLVNGKWFCRLHSKQVESPAALSRKVINKIRLTVTMHERKSLPPDTDYKNLWEAMVPALLKEVLRLRGIK